MSPVIYMVLRLIIEGSFTMNSFEFILIDLNGI